MEIRLKLQLTLCVILLSSAALAGGVDSLSARVWVSRADGSLQCGEKTETLTLQEIRPIEEDVSYLQKNGIHVLQFRKGNDGKMRIQKCGASTGNINQFLIENTDLEKLKSLNFRVNSIQPERGQTK